MPPAYQLAHAYRRIGEISGELKKAKANQHGLLIPSGGKKQEVLKSAGISTSTPNQFKLLLGRKYNRLKNGHGGDRSSPQNGDLKTSEKLAAEHGVGRDKCHQYADRAGHRFSCPPPLSHQSRAKAVVYHQPQGGAEYLACLLHDKEGFRPAAVARPPDSLH